jgi:selenocysteine lyase/cysteine desulfurase
MPVSQTVNPWYSATMTEAVTTLPNQRELFDIPQDVAYLNCAYMSPLLKAVAIVGEQAVRQKQHPWEITPSDFFAIPDLGRELFARIIGASGEDIAIVPSVSYGMAVAALNIDITAGQEILLLEDQFPSNVYPWMELAKSSGGRVITIPRIPASADADFRNSWTSRIIEAIGPQTAVVALPHCHWIDGSLIDLAPVGEAARKSGAALVLDVTQSAGAMPLDVQEIKPDFLVAASYKWLLGPYSLGFLYIAPERQGGQALEHNWTGRKGAEDFSRLVDYQQDPAPGVRRFDMGERSQLHLMPMAVKALQQVLDWGVEAIAASLGEKTRIIAERAGDLGLVSVAEELRAPHYLGLKFPDGMPADIHEQLARRQVHVSIRGDSMRVTPHLYNSNADADRLFDALQAVL